MSVTPVLVGAGRRVLGRLETIQNSGTAAALVFSVLSWEWPIESADKSLTTVGT
jgi:hypothetical protein